MPLPNYIFLAIAALGTLAIIFQKPIAAVIVKLLPQQDQLPEPLNTELTRIHNLPPGDATQEARHLITTTATKRPDHIPPPTIPHLTDPFLQWFVQHYQCLSITGDDHTLDANLLQPITLNDTPHLILGHDAHHEKYYLLSNSPTNPGIYEIHNPEDTSKPHQLNSPDNLDYIAPTIPKFLLIIKALNHDQNP